MNCSQLSFRHLQACHQQHAGAWFGQLVYSQGTAAALIGSRKAIIERWPGGSGVLDDGGGAEEAAGEALIAPGVGEPGGSATCCSALELGRHPWPPSVSMAETAVVMFNSQHVMFIK